MQVDRYGNQLSTNSQPARDAYVDAVDCLLGAMDGDIEGFERAIGFDPGFALAHIGLGRALGIRMQGAAARESVARARELAAGTTERERSHVNALALSLEGKPVESLDAIRTHIRHWPRDAMAVSPVSGVFGLIGFSGRAQREDELYEFFSALQPHYDDDWWLNSSLAFAACETGRLDQAMQLIDRSLAAQPRSGHGSHIRAHVLYEMGEPEAGLRYLTQWLSGYPRQALMHCHLSWHVATFALELGDDELAWSTYRDAVHPHAESLAPPLNMVTDAASFLWRAELAAQARDAQLWSQVRDTCTQYFPKAGISFADVHAGLAYAACGDADKLDEMLEQLRERLTGDRLPPGRVVPTLVEAMAAYEARDWSRAASLLEQALPETVRIGGSRAQRDLVAKTLSSAVSRLENLTGEASHREDWTTIMRRPANFRPGQ